MAAGKTFGIGLVKPVEAIAEAVKRETVLPAVYYGQLQGVARATSFSVASMASLDQIQQVLDSLNAALGAGATFDQWRKGLLEAPEALALPRHRLDNIFRTNIQGAYARGRCASTKANANNRPYLLYSAINDSRVRPHHLAMDGHVAAISDPVWQTWTPPAGYRCRCTVISLTEAQAKKYAEQDAKRLEQNPQAAQSRATAIAEGPDAGWDYNPCDGVEVPELLQAKAPKYDPVLAEQARAAAAQAQRELDAADPDKWRRIGNAQGSNQGGLYEDALGQRWYVKQYANPDQARTELATNAINRLIGLDTPTGKLVVMDGKTVIANAWRDDFTRVSVSELHKAKHKVELRRAYQAAALTKNCDVVGLDLDNLVVNGKGKLAIVDSGGSMAFRAQGGAKPYLAGPVDEIDTLIHPDYNASGAKVFGKYSKDELLVGLKNNLSDITKSKLETIFVEAGFSGAKVKELTEVTWARTKWLRQLADGAKATPKPKAAAYKGPVPAFKGLEKLTAADARNALSDLDTGDDGIRYLLDKGRYARDHKAFADVPEEMLAHLISYTGSGYMDLNRALYTDRLTPGIKRRMESLNAAIMRSQKFVGESRRGLSDMKEEVVKQWAAAAEQAMASNKPIEFKAFSSTATRGEFGGNVKINYIGKGHQGTYVDEISEHRGESEVLYAAGAKFKVNRVEMRRDGFGDLTLELWLEEDESMFRMAPVARFALPAERLGYSSSQGELP